MKIYKYTRQSDISNSEQVRTFPFLISTAENIVCTSNGNSHHLPNTVRLVVFVETNIS